MADMEVRVACAARGMNRQESQRASDLIALVTHDTITENGKMDATSISLKTGEPIHLNKVDALAVAAIDCITISSPFSFFSALIVATNAAEGEGFLEPGIPMEKNIVICSDSDEI